ncbi:thioredoxin-like protein [Diplodia corticola]|uniref:Thioredoxin-like protein n=1 Tax=Diplodia corticola TaxID=236234 RepID=A0A1J9RRT7_9PEZI|nr:thioredoxin-like protein [Diplodia corticola]OJD35251.1 thioredoxin-like protein [Diplodia corticola]
MPLLKLRPARNARHNSVSGSDMTASSSPTSSTRSSHSSNGTVSTNVSSISSFDHDHARNSSVFGSCSFDAEDYFNRLREDVNVSDDCPSEKSLQEAGDTIIYDVDGIGRPFKNFFQGDMAIGQRQLVLFVRHFYCGACQAYLQALTKSIDSQTYFTMPTPTNIIVVGCGSPSMIPAYKRYTGCPFPIFADPTRSLYRALGMSFSLDMGSRRPEYMKDIAPPAWIAGQLKQVGQQTRVQGMRKAMRCGNWLQVGGEFLFEDGEVIWCHRMRNYRDHTEVKALRRLLEIDDD